MRTQGHSLQGRCPHTVQAATKHHTSLAVCTGNCRQRSLGRAGPLQAWSRQGPCWPFVGLPKVFPVPQNPREASQFPRQHCAGGMVSMDRTASSRSHERERASQRSRASHDSSPPALRRESLQSAQGLPRLRPAPARNPRYVLLLSLPAVHDHWLEAPRLPAAPSKQRTL